MLNALRYPKTAALILSLALIAGCAPITATADNPKDGEVIALAQGQPLRIRWTSHDDSGWNWEEKPLVALKHVADSGKAAEAGALELKLYDFEAVAPGEERLTFAYRDKSAAPGPDDERITVLVTVR